MTIGLYVHVPLCVSKCHYCDFYSERIKANNTGNFLTGLALEVELFEEMLPGEVTRPDTFYLGGGTPSVLTLDQLEYMLKMVGKVFATGQAEERTLEINPGTVSRDKLKKIQELGINRLSVGVQSFNDRDLLAMGRKHRLDQTMELMGWLKELSFPNYSIDLIYGLPDQSLADWEYNLKQAINCEPRHISLYGLKLEEETPWGRLHQAGKLVVPDDGQQADMYRLAVAKLTGVGYNRYEIANFAKPGYESRHNLRYWNNQPYLGLGPGASSYFGNKRWTNVADIEEYVILLKEEKLPLASGEVQTREMREGETIFLALRLAEGLDIGKFNGEFQSDFLTKYQKQLEKFTRLGLLEVAGDKVRLTIDGVLLANEVFADFLPVT